MPAQKIRACVMFRVLTCLTGQHDWRLVILAGIVCFLTSLAAINLLHRARTTAGGVRTGWIVAAGAATGCGIWATHFIAILAYDPGVPIGYGVGLTVLSLLVAMVVTSLGLGFAVDRRSPWGPPLGGAVVGAGVAVMHYTGMGALELPGRVTLSSDLLLASIVAGVAFATAALMLATRRSDARSAAVAALLLALAIVSHHFIAM